MPENCTGTCTMEPRIEALECANQQHGATHREMYQRLNSLERGEAVQIEQYKSIMAKLDDLAYKVGALEARPAKRWDGLADKAIWAVVAAVIAFLLARIGL